jgi:hypothetical protein
MPIHIKIEEVAKLHELNKAEGTRYDRTMNFYTYIPTNTIVLQHSLINQLARCNFKVRK